MWFESFLLNVVHYVLKSFLNQFNKIFKKCHEGRFRKYETIIINYFATLYKYFKNEPLQDIL